MANIEDYDEIRECDYKGEHYSVRDNGKILRHRRVNQRKRPKDDVWSFGNKDESTGYMIFCGERVHRIVATAFCGDAPTLEHIVDHKDTNRSNNHALNLKWVTKIENALNNPITRARIIYYCGSIESFLKNPSQMQNCPDSNCSWMRTVSKEEAKNTYENLLSLSQKSSFQVQNGRGLNEWIYKEIPSQNYYQSDYEMLQELLSKRTYIDSLTPNAIQIQENWTTPTEFPCCPEDVGNEPLKTYAKKLKIGELFSKNKFGISIIKDFGISVNNKNLCIKTYIENSYHNWALSVVQFDKERNKYLHISCGTYYDEKSVDKKFTLARGLKWTGGEVFEDFVE